jgi:hypothetical protein
MSILTIEKTHQNSAQILENLNEIVARQFY